MIEESEGTFESQGVKHLLGDYDGRSTKETAINDEIQLNPGPNSDRSVQEK
jgi:hypothetical protein